MVLRCSGRGVCSLRHGIVFGATFIVGDDVGVFDDFFFDAVLPSSASVDCVSLGGIVVFADVVRCLDGTIGDVGLSGVVRTVALVLAGRSESDDLVMTAVGGSFKSGDSDGRRMYSCSRSVAGCSPSCLMTFFRRSSSMML